MNILICPDSFKGTLSSLEAARAIKEGLSENNKNLEIKIHPISDGGEGTLECLHKVLNLKLIDTVVNNPLGEKINTSFGLIDKNTAVIEMAKSSGLVMLEENQKNPFLTTTYGVGQMIKKALDLNVKKIIIGIGGSSTNDGGIGMAQALGIKFLDNDKKEISFRKKEGYSASSIEELESIDTSSLDKRIKDTKIIVCCDVSNKLLGIEGASFVYGIQKGAKKEDLKKLDNLLKKLNTIIKRDINIDLNLITGGGAAGGLGAGLVGFLNAKITPGLKLIAKLTGLEEAINKSDIVITGEGCMDSQTVYNKAPYEILKIAKQYNKRVYALNGFLKKSTSEFDGVYGTNNLVDFDSKEIKKNSYQLLKKLSSNLALNLFK